MFRCSQKLKNMKNEIRSFSKEHFSDLEKRVVEAHGQLLLLQNKTLANPTVINAELELQAQSKWQILATAEEFFFLAEIKCFLAQRW